jgi:hypothetical protein
MERSGSTITPPLNAAIGIVRPSGSTSDRIPNGGRPLVMVKTIPDRAETLRSKRVASGPCLWSPAFHPHRSAPPRWAERSGHFYFSFSTSFVLRTAAWSFSSMFDSRTSLTRLHHSRESENFPEPAIQKKISGAFRQFFEWRRRNGGSHLGNFRAAGCLFSTPAAEMRLSRARTNVQFCRDRLLLYSSHRSRRMDRVAGLSFTMCATGRPEARWE